jgi:hypothetical protein
LRALPVLFLAHHAVHLMALPAFVVLTEATTMRTPTGTTALAVAPALTLAAVERVHVMMMRA